MSLMLMGTFSGCYLDDDNDFTDTQENDSNGTGDSNETNNSDLNQGNTQFFFDVKNVVSQGEDDEPLEITDTIDDSTSFDSLL